MPEFRHLRRTRVNTFTLKSLNIKENYNKGWPLRLSVTENKTPKYKEIW
jgi:hypothetical protein